MAAATITVMLASGCASTAPLHTTQPECDGAVAIACVNGRVIPYTTFQAGLDRVVAALQMPAERKARVARRFVQQLIEAELFAQEAARLGIVVSDADIEAGLAAYKARFETEAQFDNYLRYGRVSLAEITARIEEQALIEALVAPRIHVSREEALEFYRNNERFYQVGAAFHASHILVPLEPEAAPEAEAEAHARIRAAQDALARGEDFARVAERLSSGPAAAKGGDLGWVEPGRMAEEFEAVMFALKPGEVSGPVRSRFGLHLIKVHATRQATTKTFEEVEPQVRAALEQGRFFTERRLLLAELTQRATIVVRLPRELQPLAHPDNLGVIDDGTVEQ